jgi:YHS domain-containing protein
MEKVKDLVCGMSVDPATSQWKTDFEGQTYHFCNASCLEEFESNPELYVARAGGKVEAPGATTTPERHEPPYTTKGGITAPKFGSAGSGGAEYETMPEAHATKTRAKRKKK